MSEFQSRWFGTAARDVQLTRFVLLRGLGFIYFVAFCIVVRQFVPLLGEHGLLPVGTFLARAQGALGTGAAAWEIPSLFWLGHSDTAFLVLGWIGVLVSAAVMLGYANAWMMFWLWLSYGSFVHVGQTFYGFGWETLLLEAGFLAIFLAPPNHGWPKVAQVPPLPVLWLYRWLAFRLFFGAGLIKLRGDPCWTDLTCLVYHYETQPNPHPLSWFIHQAPVWVHQAGVLFNHFVELVVPFGLFGPRRVRHVAGAFAVAFQVALIMSGNLSFLNWLSIVVTLSCFDDSLLTRVLPKRLVRAVVLSQPAELGPIHRRAAVVLCVVVGLLSLNPIANMVGPGQRMNASFDPLELVNTYGAFGSVGKVRYELAIEGTNSDPSDPAAEWKEYAFPCKPGDVRRRPCLVTPYHYRLDWQLWFAAMSVPERQPWLVNLVAKLLEGEPSVQSLLANDPFGGAPPAYIRITRYRYRFTGFGEPGWWQRSDPTPWLPALSRDDPRLHHYLRRQGLE